MEVSKLSAFDDDVVVIDDDSVADEIVFDFFDVVFDDFTDFFTVFFTTVDSDSKLSTADWVCILGGRMKKEEIEREPREMWREERKK